jgi:hypothetical protein
MTAAEELQKIKAVVAKPTEEGMEQLLHLMEVLSVRWGEGGSGQRHFGNRFRASKQSSPQAYLLTLGV